MVRMPPLSGLRAFEATARLLSMKAAADELGVTAGAVSQQIALLEQRLSVRLFVRGTRRLELTAAGRVYFAPLRSAFRQIAEATERVAAFASVQALTVSAPPAFAGTWLVPRLGAFRARHPEIDLRITTSRALADLEAHEVDVAIRHGLGQWKGLRADALLPVALIPVCSPAFLEKHPRPREAADLASFPLLHGADRQDWPLWLAAHGVEKLPRAALSGPSFDDQTLLLRAAAAGQGIALVTDALARSELAGGRLRRAIALAWPQAFAYWVVSAESRANEPRIAAFREWALAEGRATGDAIAVGKRRGARYGRRALKRPTL
jgi:LysR family transcriptional regulator, glycine cleavage system transcriptional activator